MTDFLFEYPSAVSGAARLIDLMGRMDVYNFSLSPGEADARAIFSDWLAVGRDLFGAMNELRPAEFSGAK
jgi:hypothetical protein